jgi:hypothetical protein
MKQYVKTLIPAMLLAGLATAARADEPAAPAPPAPRLKVQSYQNYETSDRGAQLAVTPNVSYQLNDDLELTAGPTFYSYISPIFRQAMEDAFPAETRDSRPELDRADLGATLGYSRDFGRFSAGLAAGGLSLADPYINSRRMLATGTFSLGYKLTPKWGLFGELYHTWPLDRQSGLATSGDLLPTQPGQSILTFGARFSPRSNESLSLSVSLDQQKQAWFRVGAILRF